MRPTVLLGLLAALLLPCPASAASLPALKVSRNGRFLVTADGRPFFWLGDTSWRFIEKASRSDAGDQPTALRYFEKRAAQGFNVIQTVLVHLDIPANAAGHAPLVDGDFARPRVLPGPDNDFWDDVDWFVDRAAASWFDPRTGESRPCGTFESGGVHTFAPPSSGADRDWVLVLTAASPDRR